MSTKRGNHETIEEYQAEAMLRGMWYDPSDHTFNSMLGGISASGDMHYYDADTMEPILYHDLNFRTLEVKAGKLGPERKQDDEESELET